MVNSPNLYNEVAFKNGRKDFLDGKGLIANPYPKTQESDFCDWRIGWQIAMWEDKIKKRDES